MVLISFEPVAKKFSYIDANFFLNKWAIDDPNSLILRGIFFPLATALVYLFLLPYPTREVYRIVHRHRIKLREVRQSIENDKLLSLEESRNLIRQHAVTEDTLNTENAELRSQIQQLKGTIAESEGLAEDAVAAVRDRYEKQIGELKSSGEKSTTSKDSVSTSKAEVELDKLDENEVEFPSNLLVVLGNSQGLTSRQIMDVVDYPNLVRLEVALTYLKEYGFASVHGSQYLITDAGRRKLIDDGLA